MGTDLLTVENDARRVIARVLDGLPLREALRECELSPQKFAMQLQQDRETAIAYARAQELRADLLADEVIHIADGDGDTSKARNQIQARQWLASKLHAKRYGDRIDLNVSQTIDIGSTLAEARARLLPERFQRETLDAQIIEAQGKNTLELSDNQSLIPKPDDVPDIFN